MNKRMRWSVAIGVAATGFAVALWWQHRAAAAMRSEIQELRVRNQEAGRRRVDATPAESRGAEWENLRADREAIAQLRTEIDALERRFVDRLRARRGGVPQAGRSQRAAEPSMMEEPVPAGRWRNAGQATPAATVETALWAAAGGDIEALAGTLSFDAPARVKAIAILAGLPDTLRARYATPEQLVPLLTAKDVPLGTAHLVEPRSDRAAGIWRVVLLADAQGNFSKAVPVAVRQEGQTWRLVVPEKAIDHYAAMLRKPPQN